MNRHRRSPPPARMSGPSADIQILSMGGEGDGVADGPIYVPFTLPGERVRVLGGGERRELEVVLEAAPDRTTPACAHFGSCGGCALQHWAAEPYLAWKVERLRTTLALQHLETEIAPPVASNPGDRRRLALHARKGSRDVARLGFKTRKSWAVLDISECPVADPRLVAALPALRRLAAPLFEHHNSAPTLHVTLTDSGVDVDITGVEQKSGGLSADGRMRLAELAAAADLCRVTLNGEAAFLARQPVVRLGPATVVLPPGAFLQASRSSETAMARRVVEAAAGAHRIADLYCGVGTFTFRLAEIAPVHGADVGEAAIRALLAAVSGAPGLKGVTAEVRDLGRRPLLADDLKRTDTIVFDPPRAGAPEQAAEIARSGAARAIAVSCNPATFARDARTLVDAGFNLLKVWPVDQFLWSPHLELVALFTR